MRAVEGPLGEIEKMAESGNLSAAAEEAFETAREGLREIAKILEERKATPEQ